MYELNEIDKLEIFVLMDNISDPFTQNKNGVYWNESQYKYFVQKKTEMCGANYCRACNGLSLYLRIYRGNNRYTLLFDTGPDTGLIVDNSKKIGLDLKEVQGIVLSHGHFDHYGGTISALKEIGKKNLPVYIHPELFLPRAFGEKDLVYVSYNLTHQDIEEQGGKIIESSLPIKIFDDTVLISGEVPRITHYEAGIPDEHRLKSGEWQCAPDVIDERCLIFKLKNKGVCIMTGCGHTGVINAAQHAMNLLNDNNVHFIMGGFHLAGPEFMCRITPTILDLKRIDPDYVITGHCTGRQTQALLTNEFRDKHIPYGVGGVFKFDSLN